MRRAPRHRARLALDVAVTLPLVAMGVTVANLAFGDLIRMHGTRVSLHCAMSEAQKSR